MKFNYINRDDGFVEVYGDKKLYLCYKYGKNIKMPHTNIKGIIESIDNEKIKIKLSNESKKYLVSEEIVIKNEEKINLKINDEVFLKFNNLIVNDNILEYKNVELYKKRLLKEFNYKEKNFICYSNYDKTLYKVKGKEFKYNEYYYFIINGTDNGECYENVKNKVLLIEDYKSIFNKYYNTINNQETMFYIIVYQYMEEQ